MWIGIRKAPDEPNLDAMKQQLKRLMQGSKATDMKERIQHMLGMGMGQEQAEDMAQKYEEHLEKPIQARMEELRQRNPEMDEGRLHPKVLKRLVSKSNARLSDEGRPLPHVVSSYSLFVRVMRNVAKRLYNWAQKVDLVVLARKLSYTTRQVDIRCFTEVHASCKTHKQSISKHHRWLSDYSRKLTVCTLRFYD